MTGTVCCDSSGLHTLLRAHKRAVAEGGELRLVVPVKGAVPRIMNLTGLDLFFRVFPAWQSQWPRRPPPRSSATRSTGGLATLEPEPGLEEVRLSPHAELRALSDNVLLARLRTLPRGSIEREVICEILVSRYAGLVRSCVRPIG